MLTENQLNIRAPNESILEEEAITLVVLKRQVLRQMSSFLPLAKKCCWAVMRAVTLGGSCCPGKRCNCCLAQKDAAVPLPTPAAQLPFLQVPCWSPSCWWPVPRHFTVTLDQPSACSGICSRHKHYLPSPKNPHGAWAEGWHALPYLLPLVAFRELG